MRATGLVVLGVGVVAGTAAIVYATREAKAARRERAAGRASMPALLGAACVAASRQDRFGFLQSIQAAGTLLDGAAPPSDITDEALLGRYQAALAAPEGFPLCEGPGHSLLSIAAELASRGHDYEAIQVLRVASAQVPP